MGSRRAPSVRWMATWLGCVNSILSEPGFVIRTDLFIGPGGQWVIDGGWMRGAPPRASELHGERSGGQARWQRKMWQGKKTQRSLPTPKGRPLIFLRRRRRSRRRRRRGGGKRRRRIGVSSFLLLCLCLNEAQPGEARKRAPWHQIWITAQMSWADTERSC